MFDFFNSPVFLASVIVIAVGAFAWVMQNDDDKADEK